MISRLSLVSEELSLPQLYRLVEIAHETPHYDLKKSAIALLTASLFQEPPITAVVPESGSEDWGAASKYQVAKAAVDVAADERERREIEAPPQFIAAAKESSVVQRPMDEGRLKPFPEELKAKQGKSVARAVAEPVTANPTTSEPAAKSKRLPDWSAEEDAPLIAYCKANPHPRKWGDKIVKQFPGRSAKALQMRAERLGFGRPKGTDAKPAVVKPEDRFPGDLVLTSEPKANPLTQAKESLDAMFPPGRESAKRDDPVSMVEKPKASPSNITPIKNVSDDKYPTWTPVATVEVPKTIWHVVDWCRGQHDSVAELDRDGRKFSVNGRTLWASELLSRANNMRVAIGEKPFDVVLNEAAQ